MMGLERTISGVLKLIVAAGVSLAACLPAQVSAQSSLLSHAQPLWSELSVSRREVLSPFEKHWNSLPLNEKRAWVKLADDLDRKSVV